MRQSQAQLLRASICVEIINEGHIKKLNNPVVALVVSNDPDLSVTYIVAFQDTSLTGLKTHSQLIHISLSDSSSVSDDKLVKLWMRIKPSIQIYVGFFGLSDCFGLRLNDQCVPRYKWGL